MASNTDSAAAFRAVFEAEIKGQLEATRQLITWMGWEPPEPPVWSPPLSRGRAELDLMYENATCNCGGEY